MMHASFQESFQQQIDNQDRRKGSKFEIALIASVANPVTHQPMC